MRDARSPVMLPGERFTSRIFGIGAVAIITLASSGQAVAQNEKSPLNLDVGVVGTYQNTDEDLINSEVLGSLDLVFIADWGPGELLVYAEGSSSPQPGDVSNFLGEVNGDAGSALDGSGDGRFQISELRYGLPVHEMVTVNVGLLDPTVFLDSSSHGHPVSGPDFSGIANDETTQFLGNSFVNNPVVEFPDYTLGASVSAHSRDNRFGLQLAVTSSNGLADNPNASYSELFDIGESGKGVFAAAEGHYNASGSFFARLGLWTNTRDHDRVDGTPDDRANYGLYSVLAGQLGQGFWNVRLGWADPDVSAGENFISLATEQPLGFATIGVGLARTGASDDLGPGSDDTLHAEAFLRFDINDYLQISPDIQYVENSGFDEDLDAFVYGVRFVVFFSPG